MVLNVTITKTSNGLMDYIQIMSDDQISINCVFVAEEIEVEDHRNKERLQQRLIIMREDIEKSVRTTWDSNWHDSRTIEGEIEVTIKRLKELGVEVVER